MTSSRDLVKQARAVLSGGEGRIPQRQLAVVTCMDARVDPLPALGLQPGDAHVIRNAGGLITNDVLRSLVLSQHELQTKAVDVVMHTDCGLFQYDAKALAARLRAETGRRLGFEFGGFSDLEGELQSAVELLRSTPELAFRDRVRGLVYDVATRRLQTVVA